MTLVMRRTIALALAAAGITTVLWAQTTALSYGQDTFPPTVDCYVSGAQIPGTKIPFPPNRDGRFTVEVDRDGRTLVSSGRLTQYAFARDPSPEPGDEETYRQLIDGVVVGSGVAKGFGCEGEVTTTTAPEVTTTTRPLTPCDDVECPPKPEPPRPRPPVTTTTFVPNQPGANGNDADGFAASEGG